MLTLHPKLLFVVCPEEHSPVYFKDSVSQSFELLFPKALSFPPVKEEEGHNESSLPPVKCKEINFVLTILIFRLNNLDLISLIFYNYWCITKLYLDSRSTLNELHPQLS